MNPTITRILASALALGTAIATAAEFHVAPDGSNNDPGTKEEPLATIQAGANKLQPGDTLLVRAGTYRETVTFPRSGTADKPITVKPFNRERVLITGCDPVAGWKQGEDKLWRAQVSWTLGPGKDQLFHRGQAMREARFPNESEPDLLLPVAGLSPLQPTFATFNSLPGNLVTGKAARSATNSFWKGAIYYGVHWEGWCGQSGIVGNSKKNGVLNIQDPTTRWWWDYSKPNPWVAPERGRGMLVGHRHALDAPGEWLREANGTLLFIAPEGSSPEGQTEFKRRHLAFNLANRAYIRIEGIRVQAASASLRNAEACALDHCVFEYFTHFTHFDDGRNGEIDKMGDRGPLERGEVAVFIGGQRNTIRDCRFSYSAGGGLYVEGQSQIIHNNLIEECSYTCTYLAGLMVGWNGELLSGGHTITYNTIRRCGRALLHMDGGPGTRDGNPQPYAAMLIAHNHLYDGMLQGRDGGALNSFWTDAGAYNGLRTEFRHNVIHDCYDPKAIEDDWHLGIVYWDNNTHNLNNHHNLIWAKPGTVQISHLFNAPSVNTTWDDSNRFIGEHQGGVESLRPQDFPEGRPFAFGHNETASPEIPPWGPRNLGVTALGKRELAPGSVFVAKAVSLDGGPKTLVVRYALEDRSINRGLQPFQSATGRGSRACIAQVADKAEKSAKVTGRWVPRNLVDGEYLKLPALDLGEGYARWHLVWASRNPAPKWLEIRLDSPDAAPVARLELPDTGAAKVGNEGFLQPFQVFKFPLPDTLRGKHDVHLVFKGGAGEEIGQTSFVRFEQYRGEVPLLANEAVLEVRLDRPDGELLTTIHPQATEGGLCESAGHIENENLSGRHDLHFIYRTPTTTPICLDAVRFERGR